MKTVAAVKIGNMRDPDEARRGRVQVIDMPEQPLGDEDVRIKVAYCAICGSDPHLVGGIFGWEPPFGLGHEMSGIVTEVGKKAIRKGLLPGDRVAGNFLRFCGSCYYCQNGQQQFCESADEYNRPCMAESVVWHESQVYRLPEGVSLRHGCLLEPVSIAVRLMDKIRMKAGMTVAVCGGGPIGLLAVQLLRIYGATALTLIEPIEARRRMAISFGADYAFDPAEGSVMDAAARCTGGRGYDVVIDASGSPAAAGTLPPLVAPGGQLIYAAMYPSDFKLGLNLYEYCYKREISVTGLYVAPYAFPRAMKLLPRLSLDELSSTVFDIDDAEEAFKAQLTGEHLKILIRCNDIAGE